MCTPHSVRLNQLKDMVADEIRILINSVLNQDNVRYLEEKINTIPDAQDVIEAKTRELNSILRTIQDNKEALSSLYMDKVKGVVTEAEYVIHKEKFTNTISEQQAKYTMLKNDIERLKANEAEKPDTLSLVKKYIDFEELTSEIVANFIDYINVGEKDMYGSQDVHIYWSV